MSDWKNPSFPSERGDRKVEWRAPAVEEHNVASVALGLGIGIKALLGFLIITSMNASALMLLSVIIGFDISYRNALYASALYVFWRAYDTVTFSRLLKDR